MTNIGIFTGGKLTCPIQKHDSYVGIDRANLYLIANNLPIDLAIGDFDSVSQGEFEIIKQVAKTMVTLIPEKNDTDTEAALKHIFQNFPDANVTLYGTFGGRLDHSLSNIFLPSDPEIYPFMEQITLIDCQNHLTFLPPGKHSISKVSKMNYLSFLSEHAQELTISGAKYDLSSQNYFCKKIYSSNEFITQTIDVSFSDGYLIVIQSKDN